MSDNPTRETPDARSFEERILTRFDAFECRFDAFERRFDTFERLLAYYGERIHALDQRVVSFDARLTSLEEKVDARLREMRPIWEAVQADLEQFRIDMGQVKNEIKEINRNPIIFHEDVKRVRLKQVELEQRVENLEAEPSRH